MAKSKYKPLVVKNILNNLKKGNNQVDSARMAGIGHDTYFTWIKLYPEFSDGVQQALIAAKSKLIASIVKQGRHDWKAHSWLLERRYPMEYGLSNLTSNREDRELKITIVADKPHIIEAETIQPEGIEGPASNIDDTSTPIDETSTKVDETSTPIDQDIDDTSTK